MPPALKPYQKIQMTKLKDVKKARGRLPEKDMDTGVGSPTVCRVEITPGASLGEEVFNGCSTAGECNEEAGR